VQRLQGGQRPCERLRPSATSTAQATRLRPSPSANTDNTYNAFRAASVCGVAPCLFFEGKEGKKGRRLCKPLSQLNKVPSLGSFPFQGMRKSGKELLPYSYVFLIQSNTFYFYCYFLSGE
jgi:hypothetical protein